ncbi:MAG: DUF1598 domain-containing protein [Thermoguttaceae bacterium]
MPWTVMAQALQQPVGGMVVPGVQTPMLGGLPGGFGGGSMADFDSLIQLITSTVQPESWEDVGGPGSVEPFATGVVIDPEGMLRKAMKTASSEQLSALRRAVAYRSPDDDVQKSSTLRKISLPRLERELQVRAAAGKGPTVAMAMLAGLRRIKYVFVYPETGDLVIAGPAGDWRLSEENRFVSVETGEPIVQLDDLVVVFRQMGDSRELCFGCLIVPTQEGLARVKAFAEQSAQRPLKRGTRDAWLDQLRQQLGKQNLEVYGIDPQTRVASVMLEADYHMKLVGMGLEPGVPGLESYLDLARKDETATASMSVLRWWFTLNYDSVTATAGRDAMEISGSGVQVLSENEMLEADGRRVHTGRSDDLNHEFAASFTRHFEQLCQRYPVYAELRNICDLALIAALVKRQNLAEAVGWEMAHFRDGAACPVRLGPTPRAVDSVINHRSTRRGEILVGVSGGVRVDPAYLLKTRPLAADRGERVASQRAQSPPGATESSRWWWD